MIGGAIYQLLNVPAITDLVEQLNFGLAPQENLFPRIVITERSTPENFKNGYSIINHDVEINIYASKAKDGNGGFLQASNIADAVGTILYRYNGNIAGKRIDQILLSNQEILFDNSSQCARVIMEYSVRENLTERDLGPTNTVLPVISGLLERDETLTCSTGTWGGIGTINYSYQWKRDGENIDGATSNTYLLVAGDDYTFISCFVTGTDNTGSKSVLSESVGPILGALILLTNPILSGTEIIGQSLSVTNGTWEGKPTITFAYQWRRDLANISGATSNTYTLVDADYQTTIDCVVTATNSTGSLDQDSNDSGLIDGIIPSISGVPTFAGTQQVGQTLTATAASSSGLPTPTRVLQWQRSNDGLSGWANIIGATSITYLLDDADNNKFVRVIQTETNVIGSDSANSISSNQIKYLYDVIFEAYSLRVITDSGTVENETCTKTFLNTIL